MLNDGLAEITDQQNTIIKMQSDLISKLYLMLLQHTNTEELDNCGVINQISEIVKLKG